MNNKFDGVYEILESAFSKLDETIEHLYGQIKNGDDLQIEVFENVCNVALKIIDSQREIINNSQMDLQDVMNRKLDDNEMRVRNAFVDITGRGRN